MASGFPIIINSINILTSEALYQACRFPSCPEVQKKIIEQKSPMAAKMVSKPYRNQTRQDWEKIRISIMRWCLRVKLAQNFKKFGLILEATYPKDIVEESKRDDFWGAKPDKDDSSTLKGVNALGRLLMELRQDYMFENKLNLLCVNTLDIVEFLLFNDPIENVDERKKYKHQNDEEFEGENYSTDLSTQKNVKMIDDNYKEKNEIKLRKDYKRPRKSRGKDENQYK